MDKFKPKHVLLFGGKRKSGKDHFTNLLHERLGVKESVIIKISAPIKTYWAKAKNLDYDKLISSEEYKEEYRLQMIEWSEEIRAKDPGYFCYLAIKMFPAADKSIWIVSDIRRKTDIQWFRENFGDRVQTFRISASEDVRKKRGWVFTKGVDDVASECDLDDVENWDWLVPNEDPKSIEKYIQVILSKIKNNTKE